MRGEGLRYLFQILTIDLIFTQETAALANAVGQGNPGAHSVVRMLCYFSRWYEMMEFCKETGLVGPALWLKYKDEFRQDWHALGEQIQVEMRRYAHNRDPITLRLPKNYVHDWSL